MLFSNRQQKERYVVKLYRQGKTYRKIAEEVRMSFSRIKSILDKYGADNISGYDDIVEADEEEGGTNNAYLPVSSKAYKLFSEGKTPLQVSIALNLRAPEVKTLYKEYWELRRMHSLARLYDEIGGIGISSLLQLHRSRKHQQISNEQVIQGLTIYGNDLPMVKREYDEVDSRLQALLSQEYRSEKEFEDINIRISMSLNLLKSIQAKCEKAEIEISRLAIQKSQLLSFISESKNNNSVYLKIGQFIEEKVNTLLRNNMKLLELSLISALKAFRNDPNSYRYLLHKLDQTATSDLIAMTRPDINLPPLKSHGQDDLRYHVQKEKPNDYCHACYSYDADGISRTYYENLGKEIISDIGLDSFEGIYVASQS